MTNELELTLTLEDPPPPPIGAPSGFNERLAWHLKTTDGAILRAAGAAYRGVWTSEHEYVAEQVAEHLPPFLAWILACCDPDTLRKGYEAGKLRVWSVPLEPGRRMIFESVRGEPPERPIALALEHDDAADETPCRVCGARDWMIAVFCDELKVTTLGCDRCSLNPASF